jgi:hypothetical protein
MADSITDNNDNHSPGNDDQLAQGNGANAGEARGIKRQRQSAAAGDDDDDDDDKQGRERRKIDIKFIQDKSRRHITFSKRKAGIMKKVCTSTRPRSQSVRVTDATTRHTHTNKDSTQSTRRPIAPWLTVSFLGL